MFEKGYFVRAVVRDELMLQVVHFKKEVAEIGKGERMNLYDFFLPIITLLVGLFIGYAIGVGKI